MQLNSIMDRFTKEAVQKICSLFRYCSSVAPLPAQMCLNDEDGLRKTSSQSRCDLSGTAYIHNQEFQGTVSCHSIEDFSQCFFNLVFVVMFVLSSSLTGDVISLSLSPHKDLVTTSHQQLSSIEVSNNPMQLKNK